MSMKQKKKLKLFIFIGLRNKSEKKVYALNLLRAALLVSVRLVRLSSLSLTERWGLENLNRTLLQYECVALLGVIPSDFGVCECFHRTTAATTRHKFAFFSSSWVSDTFYTANWEGSKERNPMGNWVTIEKKSENVGNFHSLALMLPWSEREWEKEEKHFCEVFISCLRCWCFSTFFVCQEAFDGKLKCN